VPSAAGSASCFFFFVVDAWWDDATDGGGAALLRTELRAPEATEPVGELLRADDAVGDAHVPTVLAREEAGIVPCPTLAQWGARPASRDASSDAQRHTERERELLLKLLPLKVTITSLLARSI
jgi:hypothetical protein